MTDLARCSSQTVCQDRISNAVQRLPLTEGMNLISMSKVWYLQYSSLNREGQQGSDSALPPAPSAEVTILLEMARRIL